MNVVLRLLPSSLVGRVFALYCASLLIFFGAGLGLFYKYQFSQNIQDEQLAAELMINVAAQSVTDSAVIGDYDTIAKTLERAIARSHFSRAQFIDAKGGVITANNDVKVSLVPPQWLRSLVKDRLFELNHNVAVGGKDYGVIRLIFAIDAVAGELWLLAVYAFALALGALVGGLILIWFPLKRWLGNFDRVRAREAEILSGAVNVSELLDSDAPEEIRHTFDILSRAANRLRAQQEEAAVTLNAIADGVITVGSNGRVIYSNPAAQHMLGRSVEEIVGRDVRDVLPNAFGGKKSPLGDMNRRIEMVGAGGKNVMLDTTLSVIQTGADAAGHVLALRDVTQQYEMDRLLRGELEMRQRALESLRHVLDRFQMPGSSGPATIAADDLDALTGRVVALMNERELSRRALDNQKFALDQHAIVSITNLDGNIIYANGRFCEISGYSQAELLGSNHRILLSGIHPAEFFTDMWHTISQGKVWHGEICNRNKRGTNYWVDSTIVPLMGGDGLPFQYIAIRTDISARKAIEAQIEEQLRFVEVLLESTPTAIYLKDKQGRYLRFNKAFEQLFGIERDQWIGKTVFDLVPGDAAAVMHAKDVELYESNSVQTYEASFTNRKTGVVREGLYWKAPLTDRDGRVTALVGTILDITERNVFEQELRKARHSAEAANKSKSDFLANMSHEIRTPMNGVIGMTDLALDTPLNEEQREYLTIVKNSAQALMVILNDILDFSKIEAGKLNIETVEFSLPETISQTLKTIVARAEKKGLTLACQFEPGLPDHVCGDPGRIRQILTNLCDNAIKFTAQGGVTVDVDSKPLEDGGSEIHLSVRDTGIGIAADKQQGVFEAFSQADSSTTRQYGGTGLGLTICARLVELMEGRIWVESEPGKGSTFHFTVRVQAPLASQAQSTIESEQSAIGQATQVAQRCLRILLVEDNPVNQLLATVLLKRWGHIVVLAENGQEAVDLFPTEAWDLVLMDMQMPVMGGLDATRLIRAAEPVDQHTPIIAMTANAMESDRQACLEAGMDDHLAKPFNAASLRAVLARLVLTNTGARSSAYE